MSGQSVNLTTLFLGWLTPSKRLTSTLCTYFSQELTTSLLESAEGETKVCGQTGYRTQGPTYESGALPIATPGESINSKPLKRIQKNITSSIICQHLYRVNIPFILTQIKEIQASKDHRYDY